MKSSKSYSTGLKELRLKLGIKPPERQAEIEKRAAENNQRVEWVVQKAKKRSQIASDRNPEPQYRWSPEEDQKLLKLRSSGKEWPSIAKKLHRSPKAVRHRFLRLLGKRR